MVFRGTGDVGATTDNNSRGGQFETNEERK